MSQCEVAQVRLVSVFTYTKLSTNHTYNLQYRSKKAKYLVGLPVGALKGNLVVT